MKELPVISVIVPCYNEKNHIFECLNSIIENDYPKEKMEILIIDGMSNDGTRKIISKYFSKYSFVKLIDNNKRSISPALNIGIKNSKGDICIRIDAHTYCKNNYLSNCVRYLDEYSADNVGGIWKIMPRSNTLIGKGIVRVLSNPFGIGNAYYRFFSKKPKWTDTVPFFCLRKEIFQKVGLFDENLVVSEDMEFNLRLRKLGYKTLLVPDIISYYYARSDLKTFCKHNLRNGLWVILPFELVDHIPISLRHLVPLIFVLSLMTFGLFSFLSHLSLLIFLFIVVLYSLCNFYFSVRLALREKDLRLLFVMPFIFASLHFSYGLGSLMGLFKVSVSMRFWKNLKKMLILDKMAKRVFDIIFSLAGLLILSPLLILIALLIKLEDKGPVFYRGVRIGRFKKPFRMFKFRTMVVNADKIGGPSTATDDPRVTKTGNFLRKYKLDELPQLINVFTGEMSFVGPRPEVPYYVNIFTKKEEAILTVKPGITDWASLWDSDEGSILAKSADPEKIYMEKIRPEKLRLQMEYIKKHSFLVDLKIIFLTLKTVFLR